MNKICEFCNGTGQIKFFKGVSRFLLSSEDCPECAGIGFIVCEEMENKEEPRKKRDINIKEKNSPRITHVIDEGDLVVTEPMVAHTMVFSKSSIFLNLVNGEREHRNKWVTFNG